MSGLDLPRGLVLHVPEFGRLEARVVEEQDGSLTLALPEIAGDLISERDQSAVTLEFSTARGLTQLVGVLYQDERADGLVRFVPAGDAHVLQRRDHVRVEIVAETALSVGEPWTPPLRGYTLNASGNGLLVAAPGDLDVGQIVALELTLPGRHTTMNMLARVARGGDSREKALAIEVIDRHDQDLLIRCLFERQREALRRRLDR